MRLAMSATLPCCLLISPCYCLHHIDLTLRKAWLMRKATPLTLVRLPEIELHIILDENSETSPNNDDCTHIAAAQNQPDKGCKKGSFREVSVRAPAFISC